MSDIGNGRADIVTVGGSSAGSVLASRLSEDPTRCVLLLEAGTADGVDGYPDDLREPARAGQPRARGRDRLGPGVVRTPDRDGADRRPQDPWAVVALHGAVQGIDGLRVVDASIFPVVVPVALNATTIMVAGLIAKAVCASSLGPIGSGVQVAPTA